MQPPATRFAASLALTLSLVACAGSAPTASPAPTATARPTPTPVAAEVTTPQDAAALVIASNPLFAGAQPQDANTIGASKWWTAVPLADGGFEIEVTVGWGDCMAGCIDRHTWTYDVAPDGTTELTAESGPEVPAVLPN